MVSRHAPDKARRPLHAGSTLRTCLVVAILAGDLGIARAGPPPAIVFVARELKPLGDPFARTEAIGRAGNARLQVLESDGTVRTLVDAAQGVPNGFLPIGSLPVDVADPNVSADGERIVFAGYHPGELAWRLYEISVDGDGMRQLTRSDRGLDLTRYGPAADLFESYDDVDSCYLPDGRICFVSTRYPGVAPDGRVRTTNLFVVAPDGDPPHRITAERFGADTPAVDPETGNIVYSRFWRTAPRRQVDGGDPPRIAPGSPAYEALVIERATLPLRGIPEAEFPGVNGWSLASLRPDGSELTMWTGVRLDRELTQAYRPSFLADGTAVGVFLPVTPFIGQPRGYGLRRFLRGPQPPVALGGPQVFPRRFNVSPRVNYLYSGATGLPDGRLLVTALPATDTTARYALYLQPDAEAVPELLHAEAGIDLLDAEPLVARATPPVLATHSPNMPPVAPRTVEEAFAEGGSFTFLCENIFFNAAVDFGVGEAPPVGQQLFIEFFMNSQRESPGGDDPPLLIERLEIPADGRIETMLPAGVPLFETIRRGDGQLALGRDGQVFHVGGQNFGVRDSTARCVGCHAGHTQIPLPDEPQWTNLAPSARVASLHPSRRADRTELSDFTPLNLVDRQTGRPFVEWATDDATRPAVLAFVWDIPLRARELIVYGAAPGDGAVGERSLSVGGLRAETFLDGALQQTVQIAQPISPSGSIVTLDAAVRFDRLVVTIEPQDVSGLYEGRPGAALSEVEVMARTSGTHTLRYRLGDASSDGEIDISDAVQILHALFLDSALLCQAAADTDRSDDLSLTDALYLTNFLFLGGPALEGVFEDCAPHPIRTLHCGSPCLPSVF